MSSGKVTLKLTEDQQNQIYAATGQRIKELHVDIASTGALSDQDLAQVSGGLGTQVYSAQSDESPQET